MYLNMLMGVTMKTVKFKIYQFNELSEDAQRRAIDDEKRDIEDEGFGYLLDEMYQSLSEFQKLFKSNLGSHQCPAQIFKDLTGQRLATYIWNNLKDKIFSRKYYDHLKTGRQIFHPCVESKKLSSIPDRWSNAYYSRITLIKDCPLTGTIWDNCLLYPIYEFLEHPDERNLQNLIEEAMDNLIDAFNDETKYILSDEHITQLLINMEYEFRVNGEKFWYD